MLVKKEVKQNSNLCDPFFLNIPKDFIVCYSPTKSGPVDKMADPVASTGQKTHGFISIFGTAKKWVPYKTHTRKRYPDSGGL